MLYFTCPLHEATPAVYDANGVETSPATPNGPGAGSNSPYAPSAFVPWRYLHHGTSTPALDLTAKEHPSAGEQVHRRTTAVRGRSSLSTVAAHPQVGGDISTAPGGAPGSAPNSGTARAPHHASPTARVAGPRAYISVTGRSRTSLFPSRKLIRVE